MDSDGDDGGEKGKKKKGSAAAGDGKNDDGSIAAPKPGQVPTVKVGAWSKYEMSTGTATFAIVDAQGQRVPDRRQGDRADGYLRSGVGGRARPARLQGAGLDLHGGEDDARSQRRASSFSRSSYASMM